MNKYGLIGSNVNYSYSKIIHEYLGVLTKIDLTYDLISCSDLTKFSFADYAGLNVTIPYKAEILKYVEEQDEMVQLIGNTNTLVKTTKAYNTDILGLEYAIKNLVGDLTKIKRVVILGNSNTAKMISELFKASEVLICSRTPKHEQISYTDIHEFYGDLIINTTPLTMGSQDLSPVSEVQVRNFTYAYDLNYNPSHNQFLKIATELLIPNDNGLLMLIMQAVYAFEIWHQLKFSPEQIAQVIAYVEGIVWPKHAIIGMPFSGKSTLGEKLKMHGKVVIDLDQEITKKYSSPEAIITSTGIDRFRQIENQVLTELVQLDYDYLICGGGVIENIDNYSLLSEHKIHYLERTFTELEQNMRKVKEEGGEIRPITNDVISLKTKLTTREIKYKIWAKNCIIK